MRVEEGEPGVGRAAHEHARDAVAVRCTGVEDLETQPSMNQHTVLQPRMNQDITTKSE